MPGKSNKPKRPAPKSRTGPKPELFKIEGMSFAQPVKKSLAKKKPAGGWPKPED